MKNQNLSSINRLGKFDMGLDTPVDVEITNYGDGYGTVIALQYTKN